MSKYSTIFIANFAPFCLHIIRMYHSKNYLFCARNANAFPGKRDFTFIREMRLLSNFSRCTLEPKIDPLLKGLFIYIVTMYPICLP